MGGVRHAVSSAWCGVISSITATVWRGKHVHAVKPHYSRLQTSQGQTSTRPVDKGQLGLGPSESTPGARLQQWQSKEGTLSAMGPRLQQPRSNFAEGGYQRLSAMAQRPGSL